jgi:hypothetical protein
MSSEEYALLQEIVLKLEERFKKVTQKQIEFKNKIEKTISETKRFNCVEEMKISLI